MDNEILTGSHVRLEPLHHNHAEGLIQAAASDPSLFRWTFVPQGKPAVIKYIDAAIALKNKGTAIPFAIIGVADGLIKGTTRYWNMEYWVWPENHPFRDKKYADVCEIGHTWLTATAIRTSINTEAKLLLLSNAFEKWKAVRVCLQTDVRNERSRAAIERIGGKFEGILRAERLASDLTIRDSARYSIISTEWPDVKNKLIERLKISR